MIGKRRRERRRQARAAIERYEYNAANDAGRVELAELRAVEAEARNDELRALCSGMEKRLDDANAELRRWGLEPVTRDLPESDEHPQRYRRHSDWRSTRTGAELAELLERHAECAPAGVDVSVAWHDDPTQFLRACGEGVVTHAYEPPDLPERPDVPPPIPPEGERLWEPDRPPLPPVLDQIKRDLVEGIAAALERPRDQRSAETIAHLRECLGEAHAACRQSKKVERGQARRITALVAELDDVRGEYEGYRLGAMQAEAHDQQRIAALGELVKASSLQKGQRLSISSPRGDVLVGIIGSVVHHDDGTVSVMFEAPQ